MYSISIKNNGSFFDIQNESKKVKDPVLYEALNSCGTLSFDTQIEDEAYEEYERLKTRVLVKEDGAIQFVGRLLRTSIDFQNTKSLVFEGELALLNDVLYPPYTFSGTIAEFLTNVVNYYNSKCSTINQINIGRITVQDKNNYIARSNEEYSTCWQAISDKLIDLCGGYISMRWVVVNDTIYRYLDYLDNPGTDASQSIEYAKNILDVGQEIDAGDICTVLYPFGAKDESTGEKIDITSVNGGKNYIESANKSIYGVVEKTIEFEDVTLPSNLLSKARAYLEQHDSSISSLTVKAIDLHVIDDSYVRFNVGDSIHVSSPPNSIDTIMMISERTRNLNNPDKDQLTLGKVIDTFTSSVDRPSMAEPDENVLNYVDIEYGLSDSSTVAPSSWSSESPVWTEGKFIWQRTKCVYINGTITYSNVACIQGAKGQDGAPGADGKDGIDGANGKDGIDGTNGKDGTSSYFFVRYSANANGSGMTAEPTSNTKYMGVATNTVNSAPTSASSYKWSLIKGSDGTNGTPGADGSSSYLHIKYSNDGKTFTANSGEELGTWIGTLVDNKLADSTTFSDYTWKKYVGADGKDGINGTNGSDGTDGRGISSIVEQYYLSSSKTTQTGGSWVTTCPAWEKGYYIWTRSKITWLNPTEVTYTTPTLAGAINSANENANNAIESIPSDTHILDITKIQTRLLLGSNGGYMEVLKDSNEKPIALRFMDSMIASSAKNVLLINQNGIGFSNSGINGPFYNAWTIDGHLSADAIYTGILQDRVGNFKLNLDTGEISVKKLTLNTPDLIFGVYPNGNYIEVKETESTDGILFKGTGKILMTPSGAFDVRNIVSNILKNQLQISSDGTSNNISLWNNLHSNANYFANSVTMGSQTQVNGTVNNAVNLYNYLVGSNTEANYISMSNDGSNKYLKINNDKSMNRLWLTRTGNNTHLQLANYSSNAGGNIYTNVLEFDSASGILMFNMDYGYPGSFERSSVTGMKMYGVDLNINSKDDMRLTASGLLYLNASADYVTKIWYNGQKLKKAVTISGDQIFISTRTMCFRVTGMTNGCLAVESVTNGTQSESSGGKYRFQTVNYTNFA